MLNIDNTRRAGKIIDVDQVKLDPKDVPGLINIPPGDFCIMAIYSEANAMYLGPLFNLPSFDGVDKWMQEHHPELCQV